MIITNLTNEIKNMYNFCIENMELVDNYNNSEDITEPLDPLEVLISAQDGYNTLLLNPGTNNVLLNEGTIFEAVLKYNMEHISSKGKSVSFEWELGE